MGFGSEANLFTENRRLKAEVERLRQRNREMVEKAASGGVLDGYREMGAKIAALEERNEAQQQEIEQARRTGNHWKMELVAANAEIERLRGRINATIKIAESGSSYRIAERMFNALTAKEGNHD